jgi:cytosine/adenosine deaminase-related metal-dependent hydrolase
VHRLFHASWVVPAAAPPLADGVVAITEGRITWVGPWARADRAGGEVVELGDGVLIPALVNAHCHLELSHLAGRLPRDRGFVGWVEALVEERGRHPREAIRAHAAAALRSLEASGTAAIGDVSNALDHLDLITASRLRAVVFYELLAWDPARSDEVVRSAETRVGTLAASTDGRVQVQLAAHAPYSASPALLEALRERGGPAAIHLAESPAESAFLDRGGGELGAFLERRGLGHVHFRPPGTSPVRHLDAIGVLRPGLVAAHCVQVDDADRATLARRGVHVVLCPRSNESLGVGLPDLPKLLHHRVRLALGTDSLASVESLDLLQDAALLHRVYPEVDPAVLVHMATAGGAEALGFSDLGTLAPGQAAALAFAAGRDVRDPCAFLVSGEAQLVAVPA